MTALKFKNESQWPLLGLAVILMLGYLPLILFGGVIVDDWGAIEQSVNCTRGNASFWDCLGSYFPLWSNRPLAPLLINFFTLSFGTHFMGYLIANSIIYISAVIITAHVLRGIIGSCAAMIFICLASFPEIAMPIIVSPVVQMTATASYLYWAISIYFICKAARTSSSIYWLVGYLFLMVSFLTYEVVLPLLILSVTLPYFYTIKSRGYFFIKYLIKFLTPVLIILMATVTWQKIVAPMLFPVVYSRLSFNPNRAIDIFNLWTSVFTAQIPALIKKMPAYLNAIQIVSALVFIVIVSLLIHYRKRGVSSNDHLKFLAISALCFLCSSLIFILSGGGVDISGYISRGLSSTWFSLSILISAIATIVINSQGKYIQLVGSGIVIFIASVNFSAYTISRDNYIESWRMQLSIMQDVIAQMKLKSLNQITVIGDVPSVVERNFNGEIVFSTPWDFGSALAILSNGSGSGAVIDSRGSNFHLLKFKESVVQLDGYWEVDYRNLWLYDFDPQTQTGKLDKIDEAAELKKHINSHGKIYVGTQNYLSLSPGEKLDFSKSWSENLIIPGGEWGNMENWGRWSLGETARLYLPPVNYKASKIKINARAFVSPQNPTLYIEISINGALPNKYTLTKFNNNLLEIPIPKSATTERTSADQVMVINFKIINPKSPKDVGVNADDHRKLGIGLIDLELIN
jgi:hypothetical protein